MMSDKDKDFIEELLFTFHLEATDYLLSMQKGLLELENNLPKNAAYKILEIIHRQAHSLKGASQAVGCQNMASICANLEAVFALWKQDIISHSGIKFNVLFSAIDIMLKIIAEETISGISFINEVNEVNENIKLIISGLNTELDQCLEKKPFYE